jgi:prepilin-type N-terminal cleavage/methylation domain-containing protein
MPKLSAIPTKSNRKTYGFTLIELLAVLGVISVLVALILPAVQQARESARRAQCLHHLKQLGIALQTYETTYTLYPPSLIRQPDGTPPPPPIPFAALRYRSHWTGFHLLLPNLEQQNLHDKYDFNGTWLSPLTDATDHRSWPLNQTNIPTLMCPSAAHSVNPIGGDAAGAGAHWMAGAPSDYSFNHGVDIIRALPGDAPPACWTIGDKPPRPFAARSATTATAGRRTLRTDSRTRLCWVRRSVGG